MTEMKYRKVALKDLAPALRGQVLVFDCPCDNFGKDGKCFGRIRIPISPEPKGWDLKPDTSFEAGNMTLTPSISIIPTGIPIGSFCAGWHGYLTNGIMEPCE